MPAEVARPRTASRSPVAFAVAVGGTAAILLLGPRASPVASAALHVVAFAAFGVLLVEQTRRPSLSRRAVLLAGAGLLVLAVVIPPTQTRDVWSYAMYGRMVSHHHASPYRHTPADFRDDPVYPRIDRAWRHTGSVYGPLFTAVSAGVTEVAAGSLLVSRLGFQLLAALAVALALLLVDRRTDGDPGALALLALNPFVVVNLVNDGHNDALVGLGVLAATVLVLGRRPVAAGGVLGLAGLVKLLVVLPAFGIAVWVWRRFGFGVAVVLTASAAVVVVGGYAVGGGATALKPAQEARLHVSRASVWFNPRHELTEAAVDAGVRGRVAGPRVGRKLTAAATVCVLVLALVLVWRRPREPLPVAAAGAAVVAYTLVGAYVLPWYAAWGLFALALVWRSWLTILVVVQAALLQLAYIPGRAPGWLTRGQAGLRQGLLPVLEAAAALVLLIVALWRPEWWGRWGSNPRASD